MRSRCARAGRRLEIKSVHGVARGMMLGDIERLEIVVRRLDFRAFDDGEAEREKDALDSANVCRIRWREPTGRVHAGK